MINEYKLTKEEVKKIAKSDCFYCGIAPIKKISNWKMARKGMNGDFIHNGIDRLDNDKGYTINNITPCCSICNRMKNILGKREFIKHCKKIAKRWRK